jgi:hypothetical protein
LAAKPVKLVDYATGRQISMPTIEELRHQYENVFTETLGYSRDELALDFPLPLNNNGQTKAAPLVLFRSTEHVAGNAYMVVEIAEPGSTFSGEIGEHIVNSGAEFFVWFDGYVDNPIVGPVSNGPYYFRRLSPIAPFERYPMIPGFGEIPGAVPKLAKRGQPVSTCPECGGDLLLVRWLNIPNYSGRKRFSSLD